MRHTLSTDAIRSARRRFFDAGLPPRGLVSDTIAQSWNRCRALGLASDTHLDASPLEQASMHALRDRHEELCRLCRPEMEALYTDAKVTGSVVILTTPDGLILDAMGSPDFLDKAARVALRPGVTWSEGHIGTNAIGTALHEKQSVEVRGAEHYFGAHRVLSCSASPILNGQGHIVGLLDLSGEASVHHMHALGMVRFAVDQIERRLLERELAGREIIRLHPDATLLGTHREGVLVFEDHHLVATNRYALDMLGVDWSEVGRCRYNSLFESAQPRGNGIQELRGPGGIAFKAQRDVVPLRSRLSRTPHCNASRPIPRHVTPVFDTNMQQVLQRHARLLDADIPILLQGETGSGKEVTARALHKRSRRADAPFVAVNCAALPENLIESELFGYRPGAFTGARREGASGLLRDADGGVLFLDEIGDMPVSLQTRLLRVLQEREVTPLGGGRATPVDFAVIAASHRDIADDVENNRFRADLYYRIAQTTLALPPLRAQPNLVARIDQLWRNMGGADASMLLETTVIEYLAKQAWPGNMRQLLGALRTLMALSTPGHMIGLDDLPVELQHACTTAQLSEQIADGDVPEMERLQHQAMRTALNACDGNMSAAARRLGISRSTLYRKLGTKATRNGSTH